jgi:hypothetical protein
MFCLKKDSKSVIHPVQPAAGKTATKRNLAFSSELMCCKEEKSSSDELLHEIQKKSNNTKNNLPVIIVAF